MSAQDRTLDRYQELMQINAASQILRVARQIGLFDQLASGQKTLPQLAENLQLDSVGLNCLLDGLIAISVVERYGDDHALAPVMQLLSQYDADLGDAHWTALPQLLRGNTSPGDDKLSTDRRAHLDSLAATQWIHTPAAMQVAEMLDLGGDSGPKPRGDVLRILDLGCGSAVWSSAMAYRDGNATITAVDSPACLQAAASTAASIDLTARFEALPGDPLSIALPAAPFDLVVIAQQLQAAGETQRDQLLGQAQSALAPRGTLVIIDLFAGPTKPRLSEAVEALTIYTATGGAGKIQSAPELEQLLRQRGFSDVRFTFVAASRVNMGLLVARTE